MPEIRVNTPQPYDPDQVASAQHKADSAREAVHQGAKFGYTARKVSDGPSVAYGGALGRFKRGQLAKEIEDKVFALKVGEIFDVVRTKQGFTILEVTECGGVIGASRSSGSIDVLKVLGCIECAITALEKRYGEWGSDPGAQAEPIAIQNALSALCGYG